MGTFGERTQRSLDAVRAHSITPAGCQRCSANNWYTPTVDGTDQVTDSGDLIWQCRECGQYSSLTEQEIAERVPAPAPVRYRRSQPQESES